MPVYGAMLETGSYFAMGSNSAYNFAKGDFSLAATVMTKTGGPVVSRIKNRRGFLLIVNLDSTVTFLTRAGSGTYYQVTSGETGILDGFCHTLVAIRQGDSMQILLDGSVLPVTGSGTGTSPVNVNNDVPLLIGQTTAEQSSRQFVGMVMNVGVWNGALKGDQIVQASFARDVEENLNLQGYWTLDNTTADLSPNHNAAASFGPVAFTPCVSCVWTSGASDYAFCQMSADGLQAEPISQLRTLQVEEGVPALFFSIMSDTDQPAFPTGVSVSLTDPTGQTYKQNVNGDEVLVVTQDGQPWGVAIVNPQAGPWRVSVTAPPSVGFQLQFQTCPTGDVVPTIEDALTPLYGPASDIPEGNLGGWLSVLAKVAVAAVAGVAVAALVVFSFGTALPALAAGLATFAAVGLTEASLSMPQIDKHDLNQAATQIGGMAGFLVSTDVLLLIDADVDADQATKWQYKAREERLYPDVTASIFNKKQKSLIGKDDKRAKVKAALLSFDTGYVTAAGHGWWTYLMGWYESGNSGPLEEILTVGKYDPREVKGKIIHMFACDCGSTTPGGLGLDVVSNGAVAFFGYSDKFIMDIKYYSWFCRCDIAVDRAMIAGKTCDEAYQAAITEYNKAIDKFRKNEDYENAARLETDRDRLVAPSVDPRFGNKNARLAGPSAASTHRVLSNPSLTCQGGEPGA